MKAVSLVRWFDSWAPSPADATADPLRSDWVRVIPFIAMHLCCGLVFLAGWSWAAVGVAAGLYAARMFAVTAFYHRYFSHRTFRTNRWWQFVFAFLGATAVQRGALWWAAHHRAHHRRADLPEDVHSPRHHGFYWAHMGWITSRANFRTDTTQVPDLMKFPELRWLDRFDTAVPVLLAVALFGLGEAWRALWPGSGTSGFQMVAWGFFVSTIVLFHATCTINSLAHRMGTRRYETPDDSRNSLLLALLTFGEGWHNNHHHYPSATSQAHRPWELDLTWYGLRALAAVGVIRELHPVPEDLRS